MDYGVVIPARNEAWNIKYTVRSLLRQSMKPRMIVVVDDGSEDNTAYVAEKEGAYVVRIERKSKAPATGTPYLAYVINRGLQVLKSLDLDFVMISGADSIYLKDYVYRISKNMIKDHVVIASGIAVGEKTLGILSIRGSGRLINTKWFQKIGFQYPIHYGYETYLLLKALASGFKVAIYDDIKFYLLRKTSMNPRKAYFYGKAMKALGYPELYAIGRIAKILLSRGINEAKYMMLGYLSKTEKYHDIEGIAKYILIKIVLSKLSLKKIL